MRRIFSHKTLLSTTTIPLVSTLTRQTLSTEQTSSKTSSQQQRNHFMFYAMAAGLVGFVGYQALDKKNSTSLLSRLSNTHIAIENASEMIHLYLTICQLSVFKDNLNASNGKRHIFFRAETITEAHNTMQNGKSP